LSTVDLIYAARPAAGEAPRGDLIQTKADSSRRATAERIMRFFRTRRSANGATEA
jgi:hypothetical protein